METEYSQSNSPDQSLLTKINDQHPVGPRHHGQHSLPGSGDPLDPQDTGLPLEQYARTHGFHVAEVWRLIRGGELIARPQGGILWVYPEGLPILMSARKGASSKRPEAEIGKIQSPDLASAVMNAIQGASYPESVAKFSDELPSLPPEDLAMPSPRDQMRAAPESKALATFPEVALLLDHLSLAKEENKEIIKLTQDTIQRVTTMCESIVEMKNEIIEAKSAQIADLKERLGEQNLQIQSLNQEKEDLEMLARSITTN